MQAIKAIDVFNFILIVVNIGLQTWEHNVSAALGWFVALVWFGAAMHAKYWDE